MSVKVTGLDLALRVLEDTLPDVARDEAAQHRLELAREIANEAKRLAPVKSGNLRKSIFAAKNKTDPEISEVYVKRSGRGDAFYWRFLEYGQGPDGVAHGFFMRARENVLGSSALTDKRMRRIAARLKRIN